MSSFYNHYKMIESFKNSLRKYKTKIFLQKGLEHFKNTGVTTPETYNAFRRMFILSRGAFNDRLANKLSKKIGKDQSIEAKGVLGNFDKGELKTMVDKMKEEGFYIFDAKLSKDSIQSIYDFALTEPLNYVDVEKGEYSKQKIIFDENNLISPRYRVPRQAILKSNELQQLFFDDSLLAFAQEYLGCKPILDHLDLWWSVPFFGKGKSKAAQMYHFDMDRIKFMKFFFYITDVNTHNGPHCYVKGSHKKLPSSISRDGRFTDEEIERVFGAQNCLELMGQKGTIMAVDTRGFHKGKELFEGKRLIFQIEFAINMFGQTYPTLSKTQLDERFWEKAKKYSYNQIFKDF